MDFEDLGWGYASYDIATALFGAIERPDHTELADAFARAYATRRPLSADFALELRLFQVMRTIFLTSLVVTTGDLGESRWWEGYYLGLQVRSGLASPLTGRGRRQPSARTCLASVRFLFLTSSESSSVSSTAFDALDID